MSKSPRLSRRTFQEWKGHPTTEEFCQYLRDRSDHLKALWGETLAELDPSTREKAVLLHRLANLKWDEVREFYDIEETDDDEV